MKKRAILYLLTATVALVGSPAACSNNGDESAGDGDSSLNGAAGSEGDGDLTPGDGDSGRTVTCDGFGDSCSESDACCSGYCDPESDSCSCAPAGNDCRDGNDCCSGQCNPETNRCVQILGSCGQGGTRCNVGTECCTLSCVDGACSEDACVQDGDECNEDGECCGGKCQEGSCAAINEGSGASCATSGNACDDASDCCSGLCNDEGRCGIGASYCVQGADVCSSNTQCCGGLCIIEDGDSTGYCGSVTPGGTRCDNRKIAGEVCAGDCSECCSRTCAPYGPSGLTICQPPTGCRTDGELCRNANDCCGGNPDSSIPGAGQAQCLREDPEDLLGRCKVGGCNPHGAICGSPEDGTAACSGSLSAPNGEKCCGSNQLDRELNPCSVDSLLVPRCDVLEGCVEPEGECGTADDCCNGNPCVQNGDGVFVCFELTDDCVPTSGPCTADADCCVGSLCIREPGEATGVCGDSGGPPGGMGGNTGTGGSDGSGGGTPCASYGQTCESHDDCCGDVPCDPASGTCRYTVR